MVVVYQLNEVLLEMLVNQLINILPKANDRPHLVNIIQQKVHVTPVGSKNRLPPSQIRTASSIRSVGDIKQDAVLELCRSLRSPVQILECHNRIIAGILLEYKTPPRRLKNLINESLQEIYVIILSGISTVPV
jgi:hypothetical protein